MTKLYTLLFVAIATSIFCQNNNVVFKKLYNLSLTKEIPLFEMPGVDNDSLRMTEGKNNKDGTALKFGHIFNINIDLLEKGKKIIFENGSECILLRIKSRDAYSINLKYDNYYLNDKARLFIFSNDGKMTLGPFDHSKNRTDKKFSSGLIKGDCIVIGLYLPNGNAEGCSVRISEVIHAFINTFPDEKAGDCYIDIVCPIATQWQTDKRAVARVVMGSYYCSGALVNNTRQNGKQYFLTANHCWEANEDVSSWHFYFNYEAATCGGFASSFDYVGNAVLLAKNPASDFCLVEIGETIPASEQPYFAGWSNFDEPTDSVAVIHHPGGTAKKISFDYDMVTTSTWGSPAGNHWRVNDYDTSSTEGGSSGAPLFNKYHRIIGQLHGGSALCENDLADEYGKFSLSWDYSSNAAYSLKPWLDPDNSGIETINGYDPVFPSTNHDAQIFDILYPSDEYCLGNPQNPAVVLRNLGASLLTSASVGISIDDGPAQYFEWDGSMSYNQKDTLFLDGVFLPEGNHIIQVWVTISGGIIDNFHYNDTLQRNITGINGQLVTLDIYGRKYYEDDIIWSLKNSINQTISSGGPYETPFPYVQLHISEDFCLEEDCYTFTIQDNNCGGTVPGYFELINTSTTDILGSGCHNGTSQSYEFCIDICNPPFLNLNYDTIYLCNEESSTLSIDAFGENLNFQWFFNAEMIPGQTNSFIDLPSPVEGIYSCSVWNECDSLNELIACIQLSSPETLVIFGDAEAEIPVIEDYYTMNPDNYLLNWTVTGGTIVSELPGDTISVLWENAGTGIVTLDYFDQFGCQGTTTSILVNLTDPVMIGEMYINKITIYSEMDSKQIIIEQSGNECFNFELIDILGKTIASQQIKDKKTIVEVNYIPSGLFLVLMTNSSETICRKIYLGNFPQ